MWDVCVCVCVFVLVMSLRGDITFIFFVRDDPGFCPSKYVPNTHIISQTE